MENSHCLCGEGSCKIYYLKLVQAHPIFQRKIIQEHLLDNKDQEILENFAIFLEAGVSNLVKNKKSLLEKYGLKDNIFQRSPKWLMIWANFILLRIEDENWNLKQILQESGELQEFQLDIQDLTLSRVEHLMNAISKIENFCQYQNFESTPHPVNFLSASDQTTFLIELLQGLQKDQNLRLSNQLNNRISKVVSREFDAIQRCFEDKSDVG